MMMLELILRTSPLGIDFSNRLIIMFFDEMFRVTTTATLLDFLIRSVIIFIAVSDFPDCLHHQLITTSLLLEASSTAIIFSLPFLRRIASADFSKNC
jgi:hypothetical protein